VVAKDISEVDMHANVAAREKSVVTKVIHTVTKE